MRRRTIMDRYAAPMMGIPGIDAFGALMPAPGMVGAGRFGRPDRTVSWAGMCPRVSQSGDPAYYGRMKKASNGMVNWHLVQAAHTAARTGPRMQAYFEMVVKRHAGRRPAPHTARRTQDDPHHPAHAVQERAVRPAERVLLQPKAHEAGPRLGRRD